MHSDPNGPKVSKKSEMVICYSNIYFLHTSRLFKHHRPPENIKKGRNFFLGKIKNHDSKILFLYHFFLLFRSFGVNLMGKAINLSLKAIKATERPDIGQICNLL